MSGLENQNPETNTTDSERGTAFCPKCGKPRVSGGKFCKYCGCEFEIRGTKENHHSQSNGQMNIGRKTAFLASKKSRIVIAGVLICTIVAIAVAQCGIFSGRGKSQLKNPEVKRAAEVARPTKNEKNTKIVRSTEAAKPTENLQPTEVVKPTEAERSVGIGQTIRFGSYEQDNNTSNGKEKIEWIVLAKEGNKILITSKYGLDAKPYNTEYKAVTWETCSLRKWLNDSFLNNAFSEEERSRISVTRITAEKNPEYDTDPGRDTEDKVFLLSIQEAEKYFSSDQQMVTYPTAYAIAQGAYECDDSFCGWWLRSPGYDSNIAADAYHGGGVNRRGYDVDDDDDAIRPALWIELNNNIEIVQSAEISRTAENELSAEVGQTIRFGSYEQDNNLSNGKEEIEWIVLAKENNKMLVISKFCLEAKAYNEKGGSATWEGSTLREWLNSSFLNSAFSEEEKNQISVTTVSPDNDPEYDTGLEKDTNDKIFLLSMKEAKKYFGSDDERMAKATAYAIASGPDMMTYKHEEWGESGNEKWDGNCFWWLRSPSYLNLLDIGRYTEMNVALQGNINIQGHGVANDCNTVRPAMWINMES